MKRMMKLLALLTVVLAVGAESQTRVHVGLSFGGERGPSGFYLGLTDRYRVPYDEICMLRDAGIPERDMSDILYIYTHSNYSLRHIVALRLRGASWLELYGRCGIPRDVYFRTNGEFYRSVPPHGNAYGYFKNHGMRRYASYDRDHYRGRDERGNGHGKHRGWK